MSESDKELACSGLSTGKKLCPLHPDFPWDTTTERFQRTWQRAVAELNAELNKFEKLVSEYENDKENASKVEAKRCGNQTKKFLNEVIGLRSEAGMIGVEDGQVVQNAELALTNLERRLSLRGENIAMSPGLRLAQTVDITTPNGSEAFWEVAVDDLHYDQL
jgi:hypothetical protein